MRKAEKQGKELFIRMNDSGDFFNIFYIGKWLDIVQAFPSVTFYGYTKEVDCFKWLDKQGKLPKNLKFVFSFGGEQDELIDIESDAHSVVLPTKAAIQYEGYTDASDNDLVATQSKFIGLAFHHAKAFKNTEWGAVYNRFHEKQLNTKHNYMKGSHNVNLHR
jgi:hypothetical protein